MNESFLHILLVCFIAYQLWTNFNFTRSIKRRRRLKEIRHQVKHQYRLNRDIYPEGINEELLSIQDLVIKLQAEVELSLDELEARVSEIKSKLPISKYAGIGEKVEVIVIAFALAFAFRAVVLQPFKIPTNSMRPTLHGVNVYSEAESKAEKFKEGWLYPIYYGRAYYDVKPPSLYNAPGEGSDLDGRAPDPRIGLLQKLYSKTYFKVGGELQAFPGTSEELLKAYKAGVDSGYAASKRELEGYVETGDHLFVNRYSYNFREPDRGDVAVFQTNGIIDGYETLRGQFYIKRLVGLPGDTLRILENGNLLLKQKGAADFVNMGEVHEGFKDVMSQGKQFNTMGYQSYFRLSNQADKSYKNLSYAYSATGRAYEFMKVHFTEVEAGKFRSENNDELILKDKTAVLTIKDRTYKFTKDLKLGYLLDSCESESGYALNITSDYDEYILGDRQYFMLGDNSQSSLDSRFWGPVPRENLLGTAHSVFWPFSTRWGWVNK